ncbi:MAG: hypothetical protein ACHQ15_05260 [Candidatus Limnocylindrales bacterium]
MSFLDRAKQAAEQAKVAATQAAGQAKVAAAQATKSATETAQTVADRARAEAPGAAEKARAAAGRARSSLVTAVERIDPRLLADIVIKATALQEKTNGALRTKGSAYRIAEITITATIPPQIGFTIARIGDIDVPVEAEPVVDSTTLLAEGAVTTTEETDLEGDAPA